MKRLQSALLIALVAARCSSSDTFGAEPAKSAEPAKTVSAECSRIGAQMDLL